MLCLLEFSFHDFHFRWHCGDEKKNAKILSRLKVKQFHFQQRHSCRKKKVANRWFYKHCRKKLLTAFFSARRKKRFFLPWHACTVINLMYINLWLDSNDAVDVFVGSQSETWRKKIVCRKPRTIVYWMHIQTTSNVLRSTILPCK